MKNLFSILFCFTVLFCAITFTSAYQEPEIENYLRHPVYDCIQCLCHARTGCWRRQNCARYSISKAYWQDAGGLTVNNNVCSDDEKYKNCIRDENCIVGTIIRYTEKFGKLDCNCDGKFDCKDRLAIHLFGANCETPRFTSIYASRFNDCASRIGVQEMLAKEGPDDCTAPPAV